MTDTDKSNAEIQRSLDSFTRHFAAFISDQYSEMRNCSFFNPVPNESLEKLVKVAHMLTFKAGDKIITEDDAMRSFYVILFGSATVYVKKKKVGTIIGGECMGEGAFFARDNQTRLASVVADGELILLEITKNNIDVIDGETQKYLNKALLLAMFNKLQAANKKINELSCENERLHHARPVELSLTNYDFK